MVVEKEEKLAEHQTGRNSGVLHSGIYYKPDHSRQKTADLGSWRWNDSVRNMGSTTSFMGKVIVATQEDEIDRLKAIYQRGQANGVNCELILKDKSGGKLNFTPQA